MSQFPRGSEFDEFVGGDYNEYDEMLILAEAQKRGISFEKAFEMIVTGNGELIGGKSFSQYNGSHNQQYYGYEEYEEDNAPAMFYDVDGNPIEWSQEESDAYQSWEASMREPNDLSLKMSQVNLGQEAFPPLSKKSPNNNAAEAAEVLTNVPKTKLKATSAVFVPKATAAPFVPSVPSIVPTVSSSGGRTSYSKPVLDVDNLNLSLADCPFYFGSGCTKGTNCKFRHCIAARTSRSVCVQFTNRIPCSYCIYRHSDVNKLILNAPPTSLVNSKVYAHGAAVSPKSSPTKIIFAEWSEWAEAADELGVDGDETTWEAILAHNKAEIELHARAKKDADAHILSDTALKRFDQVDNLRLEKWKNIQKSFAKKSGLKILPKIPGTW